MPLEARAGRSLMVDKEPIVMPEMELLPRVWWRGLWGGDKW
jgi:hypothetical protein